VNPHEDSKKRDKQILCAKEIDTHQEELLQRSSLFQEFLAERDEVLRHKWIESEKVGRDIGFERALLNWILTHRTTWRTERKQKLLKQSQVPHGNPP